MNIFGRDYEEIGSSSKGLILKNSGKIKILWGRSLIDLLTPEGKLNTEVSTLIKEVFSKSEILKDGFYYYNNTLLAKVGNDIIDISSSFGNSYVSFLIELDSNSDEKYTALLNIGLVYKTYSENNNYPTNGIVYIEEELSLFIVQNGKLTKYDIKFPSTINKPLKIEKEGVLIIEGEGNDNGIIFNTLKIFSEENSSIIESSEEIIIKIEGIKRVLINNDGIEAFQIQSPGTSGFIMKESLSGKSSLEIDEVNVRDSINLENYNITSNTFINLLDSLLLINKDKILDINSDNIITLNSNNSSYTVEVNTDTVWEVIGEDMLISKTRGVGPDSFEITYNNSSREYSSTTNIEIKDIFYDRLKELSFPEEVCEQHHKIIKVILEPQSE